MSYGINSLITQNSNTSAYNHYKIVKIKSPSKTMIFIESKFTSTNDAYLANPYQDRVDFRHNGSLNAMMLGGNVVSGNIYDIPHYNTSIWTDPQKTEFWGLNQ